jgi:glyoxylase-like metal-dependent hydrolase (beta-lactamase superfamily II)
LRSKEKITMKIECFKVTNGFINNQCYLIHKNGKGVLVDPAWDFMQIHNFLLTNNIYVIGVLLTHSHVDHVDLVNDFAKKYACPVFMSAIEIDFYGFQSINLEQVEHLKIVNLEEFVIIPILTPGHTKGSICYLINEELFTGDTFFIEGVGLCDCIGGNVNDMYNSVQFIKSFVSDTTKFWPGHSYGKKTGQELKYIMKNNIYFMFETKSHFTKFRMRKNRINAIFGVD